MIISKKKTAVVIKRNKIFFFQFGIVMKIYQSLDYMVKLLSGRNIIAKLNTTLVRREIIPNVNSKVRVKIYVSDTSNAFIERVYRNHIQIDKLHNEYRDALLSHKPKHL